MSHPFGKAALVGPYVGWGRASMDLQGRSYSVSQVNGVSDIAPAYWYCGGEGSTKERWPLLTPVLDTQSLPVYHWCPSSCHPSVGAQRERVCVVESVCVFPQRNCLGLQQPPPPTQSPLVFTARSCATYLPGTGILGWGTQYGSRTPHSQDIPSEFLSMSVRGQPVPCLCPSYQSGWMCFFQLRSCQTFIQLNF